MDTTVISGNTGAPIILSVCLMTYNHVSYIQEAVESVLAQVTGYSYEVVIGEDFSTDGTREIVLDYAARYPEKIRLAKSESNLGMVKNFLNILDQCHGKYIALLEGDDKWLDKNKINTQLDFLEKNPEYTLSCHNAWVKHENSKIPDHRFNSKNLKAIKFEDIILEWKIPTASILFRREALIIPEWFEGIRNWDYTVQFLVASRGSVHYLPEPWSLYRKHQDGNSYNDDYSVFKTGERLLALYDLLSPLTDFQLIPLIEKKKASLIKELEQYKWIQKNKILYRLSPSYIKRKLVSLINRFINSKIING